MKSSTSLVAAEPSAAYLGNGGHPLAKTVQTAKQVLAVFFRIAEKWGLSANDRQVLLGVSRSVIYRWQAGQVSAPLDGATAERLSYIFRIYAALQVLLPIDERADSWVRQPNTSALFGGGTALGRMLGGQVGDLKDVADHLDAQRGGSFA